MIGLFAGLLLVVAGSLRAASLGTTGMVVGPLAGTNSVVLAESGSWTATANDTWLHLSTDYQSGAGSTNVLFSYDANTGDTRTR